MLRERTESENHLDYGRDNCRLNLAEIFLVSLLRCDQYPYWTRDGESEALAKFAQL